MGSEQLKHLTATELARLIASGDLSPVDLVEGYLERIDRFDSQLNSYITVCRDEALQAAQEAERAVAQGDSLGPLHGLPIAVKDQFETEGVLTTAGSSILADYVPRSDATVVARAKRAGAILLGKLNMPEFAAMHGDPYLYGEPRNPWDQKRSPGVSSSGSAIAIAASLCAISLGEDTGSSIRQPASLSGIVGLRPTWGRVSRYGLLPVCWSMDTAGPMTRTVEDSALLLNVIAGHDPHDPLTSKLPVPDYVQALGTDLRGIRVGVIREFLEEDLVEPEVLQAIQVAAAQLRELGANVEDVSIPLLADVGTELTALAASDAAFVHRNWLRTRSAELGPGLRRRWLSVSLVPGQVLQKAARVRALVRREWLRPFEYYDALICPTTLTPAQEITYHDKVNTREEAESRFGRRRSPTLIAALAGTPAMSVPCGFSSQHLPIGLQIMSSHFREEVALKVGYSYQEATSWHTTRPFD